MEEEEEQQFGGVVEAGSGGALCLASQGNTRSLLTPNHLLHRATRSPQSERPGGDLLLLLLETG